MFCAFHDIWESWGWPACYGGLHRHHVISKSKLAKNKQARKLVEGKYKHIFLQPVCMGHNCSKYADTWYARRFLLKRYPEAEVRAALEEIRSCYTGDYPELNYEALCDEEVTRNRIADRLPEREGRTAHHRRDILAGDAGAVSLQNIREHIR